MTPLPQRTIGDVSVAAIGMGAMTLTQVEGYDRKLAERTVHAALDAGVQYFDTADSYGPPGSPGVNETVLAECLASYPGDTDDVLIGTKAGHLRFGPPDSWWLDGSPKHLREACIGSMQRLGLDVLPFLQWHRPDPQVPFTESIGALGALHDEGLVRRLGVSNVSDEQAALAKEILGSALVAVQNPMSPDNLGSLRLLRRVQDMGLAFLAYSPFGGRLAAKQVAVASTEITEVAAELEVSRHRVVLAWLLRLSPTVIPIPGASRPESITDNVAAAELSLSDEQFDRVHTAITANSPHKEKS